MGRKPKDPTLQAAAGNPGRRPVKRLPRKKPRQPSRPGWFRPAFDLSGEAQAVWDRSIAHWRDIGYLRSEDMPALSRYVVYLGEWVAATKTIEAEGHTIDAQTVTGGTLKRRHPAVQVRQGIETTLLQIEAQFGFTPNARQLILSRVLQRGGGASGDLFEDKGGDAPPAESLSPLEFLADARATIQ